MSPLYRRIGPFEIRAEIGSGGMADVFVAEDTRSGAVVALKVPRRDADIRRAEREGAWLQAALAQRDPRVARVHEIGEDDGVPYIAMELVEGEDLSERIARGPLDPREAVRVAIELCDLLAVAHEFTPPALDGAARRGIVHGDLKPRNVRLEPSGRVRVVDFGIAKALSETRTRTRNEFGSLPYSSPERVDSGQVDGRSDLWALAVLLHEMLTGHPPFCAQTPRELEERIVHGPPPPPLPAHCPRSLDAVLHKALQPEWARRYATAAAFGEDLRAAMSGAVTLAEREDLARGAAAARRVGHGGPNGNGGAPPVQGPSAAENTSETTRRNAAPDDATRRTGAAATISPAAAPVDDATRRTGASADEATRRMGAAAAVAVPSATAPPISPVGTPPGGAAAPPAASAAPKPRVPFRRVVKRVLILIAIVLVANEVMVFRAAQAFSRKLPRYGRSDLAAVWNGFVGVRDRSVLKIASLPLSFRVERWLVDAADDIMADYLSDTPTIREGGWRQAHALLQRAVELAPGSSATRGRLRYTDGQLARIDAEALRERRSPQATARFNEARRAFEDAASLRRGWPDPYLGLARVQASGFADVDRTRDALARAQRAGYRLGDRETAVEADAHLLRAERTWRAVPGLPDESHYLERIRDDLDRALELYDAVPAYGSVRTSIRRVHTLRDQVEARLAALDVLANPPFAPSPDTSVEQRSQ